jgi:hypothetical protein
MSEHDQERPAPGPAPAEPDELAPVLRAAFEARAATATVEPEPWARFVERRSALPGRSARVYRQAPMLVMAAAAVILVLIGAMLRPDESSSPNVFTGGTSVTGTVAPPGPPDGGTAPPPPPDAAVAPPGPAAGTTTIPGAPPGGAGGVRALDLANATFPTTVCPEGLRPPGGSFTLRAGRVGFSDDPGHAGIAVSLTQQAYGDVTGDGRDDAITRFSCGLDHTDDVEGVVAVLTEDGGRLALADMVLSSGTDNSGSFVVQPVDPRRDVALRTAPLKEEAEDAAFVGGRVVVRWGQYGEGEEFYGAGYTVEVTYRWDGAALRTAAVSDRRVVPYPDIRPGTQAFHAIRRADLSSMALPLAAAGREPRATLCADLFASLGPLRDVNLVGGAATVVGADGQPRAATVHLDDVYYLNTAFVPGGAEDAVALLRCNEGDREAKVPVVVHVVSGGVGIYDLVPRPAPQATAVALDPPRGAGAVEITWMGLYEASLSSPGSFTYRWDRDIGHLVPV